MSKFNIGNMNLYYGDFHALKDINMEIQANEITAFIGPSGCGKSTFLKSLNRMNDLVDGCRITGKIELDGEDIYGNIDVNLLRKRVGMVFQNPNDQIFKNTAFDEVMFGPLQIGMSKKQAKEVALKALDMVGLKGAEKINPYELGYRDAFLSPEEFVAYKKANA